MSIGQSISVIYPSVPPAASVPVHVTLSANHLDCFYTHRDYEYNSSVPPNLGSVAFISVLGFMYSCIIYKRTDILFINQILEVQKAHF